MSNILASDIAEDLFDWYKVLLINRFVRSFNWATLCIAISNDTKQTAIFMISYFFMRLKIKRDYICLKELVIYVLNNIILTNFNDFEII